MDMAWDSESSMLLLRDLMAEKAFCPLCLFASVEILYGQSQFISNAKQLLFWWSLLIVWQKSTWLCNMTKRVLKLKLIMCGLHGFIISLKVLKMYINWSLIYLQCSRLREGRHFITHKSVGLWSAFNIKNLGGRKWKIPAFTPLLYLPLPSWHTQQQESQQRMDM